MNEDARAGWFFVACGSLGGLFTLGHDGSAASAAAMSFPRVIAPLLVVVGIIVLAPALPPGGPRRPPRLRHGQAAARVFSRPCIAVTCSVLVFAAFIDHLGLLLATLACVLATAGGARDMLPRRALYVGACLAIFVSVLFVGLLRQPILFTPFF